MIHSMTAFAHKVCDDEWGSLIWEIRSVNHRYLELGIHLPDRFTQLEADIRKQARKGLRRGKVDCCLKFQPKVDGQISLRVNRPLVAALLEAGQEVVELASEHHVSPMGMKEVLTWPGVLICEDTCIKAASQCALGLFDEVLASLLQERQREGLSLRQILLSRLQEVVKQIGFIQKRLPKTIKLQRERLISRFTMIKKEMDPGRLEQEMLVVAQKTDIAEEVDRMQTHTSEITRLLVEGGLMGRRLDFLLQELNREANTLGAKALDKRMSQAAVTLKVLIEQMREQVQNLE